MLKMRPYQQQAHDAAIDFIKNSIEPCLLELATGAGKSIIVAELAQTIHRISKGKRILCLVPSKELLEQNREKYLQTGNPASAFSASLGLKCLKHPVVFATPQSVKNSIDKFGDKFAAIIIDEAHKITPSVKTIIEHFKSINKKIRVIGMTATPYRMGSGYIYKIDEKNNPVCENESVNPFFFKLLYKVTAPQLIEMGYLTKPVVSEIGGEAYDVSNLTVNKMGKFDSEQIDKAFLGHGRKTAAIVNEVVQKSRDRQGVMFFAATIQHADEIIASLPPEFSSMVTGETPKKERESILKRFKNKRIKYIVNVAVLTTGFDAPHVDVIALLRATDSVSLLQQIIGRGLRLSENKTDVLILDYAGNIERHCPDGDVFAPRIQAKTSSSGFTIDVNCPTCNGLNKFSGRPNPNSYEMDKEGYFIDLAGEQIISDMDKPLPAHFGRRCQNYSIDNSTGEAVQCSHRWSHKDCKECGEENDIAARYCKQCKGELIDPNEKLQIEFKKLKKNPYEKQIDEIINIKKNDTISQAGNPCVRVEFTTPYRSFTVWIQRNPKTQTAANDLAMFKEYWGKMKTVTYKKEPNGFYKVLNFNEEIQYEPEKIN